MVRAIEKYINLQLISQNQEELEHWHLKKIWILVKKRNKIIKLAMNGMISRIV